MARRVFGSLVIVMVLMGALAIRPAKATAAPAACAPAGSTTVDVLARREAGEAFVKIGTAGVSPPYLDPSSNRVFVPARALASAIAPGPGAARWDPETRTATFVRGTHSVAFTFAPGRSYTDTAVIDGATRSVPAYICSGAVFTPVRSLAVGLGAGVQWYSEGTVVVDPAWSQDPTHTSDPSLGTPDPTPASCESFPRSVFGWLTSPIRSSRQAARSAACEWFGND